MKEGGRKQQTKSAKARRDKCLLFILQAPTEEIREQLEYKGFKAEDPKRLQEQRGKKCRKHDVDCLKMDEVAGAQLPLLMQSA